MSFAVLTLHLCLLTFTILCNGAAATLDLKGSDEFIEGLPTYGVKDVAKHFDSSNRIWISWKRGVYDITDFLRLHPGGDRIRGCFGKPLEPFWEMYPVHHRNDSFSIMAKLRIGNFDDKDLIRNWTTSDIYYQNEPKRNSLILPKTSRPFCGETTPSVLPKNFFTPNEIFYVRNHYPVPQLDPNTYNFSVEGIGLQQKTIFNLADLKGKFAKVTLPATLQCGGNRRSGLTKFRRLEGVMWTGGGIGNAMWGGVRLRDVLTYAGFDLNHLQYPERYHIQFEGYDCDPWGGCYGGSFPLSFLLDSSFEPLLAYEMNGVDLSPDHGYPVRVLIPGIIGGRSVKWIAKIIISGEESPSPWQRIDFKAYSPNMNDENVDFSSAPPIYSAPVNSYICSHKDGDNVEIGAVINLQGWAHAGDGKSIIRVELSSDQGYNWDVADISQRSQVDPPKNWEWVLWEMEVNITNEPKEFWVKAVDNGYNQQVSEAKFIWNYKGLLNNAFHRVKLIPRRN